MRRDLLRSDAVRAGIAAAAALVISVLTVVTLDALEISDSATVIALLLLPLLVFGVVSGKIQELTGPGGWGAKFAELKRQQDVQGPDIESIRVALRGLVSKYELESRTRFNLHDYVVLTQEGRRYLDLYEATSP